MNNKKVKRRAHRDSGVDTLAEHHRLPVEEVRLLHYFQIAIEVRASHQLVTAQPSVYLTLVTLYVASRHGWDTALPKFAEADGSMPTQTTMQNLHIYAEKSCSSHVSRSSQPNRRCNGQAKEHAVTNEEPERTRDTERLGSHARDTCERLIRRPPVSPIITMAAPVASRMACLISESQRLRGVSSKSQYPFQLVD